MQLLLLRQPLDEVMGSDVWGTENRERGGGHFPGGEFNQRTRLADARFADFCGLPSYVALKAQLLLPQVSSAIERHISDSTIVGFLSDSQGKSYAKPDNFVWLANRLYS